MPTIKEVKMELRHREWAEQIAECQNSGMSVREWCQSKGLSYNTYYRRLRAVRLDLLKQADSPMQKIVPISVSNELCEAPSPVVPQPAALNSSGSVVMRKDGIEIELPQDISEDTILALLRGLKQC
jgi:hypothetical protein